MSAVEIRFKKMSAVADVNVVVLVYFLLHNSQSDQRMMNVQTKVDFIFEIAKV
jgi:hypothetical protein